MQRRFVEVLVAGDLRMLRRGELDELATSRGLNPADYRTIELEVEALLGTNP